MAERYKFYIQKYPQGKTTFPVQDIEASWNCTYKQFKDFFYNGDIKNTYTEDFVEKDGLNVYIPAPEELTHSSYDCTLGLLFNKATAQEDARAFYNDIAGQKVEYHDTFRNRYVTLLLTKQPKIEQEVLYGNRPYMLVSFTFTNIDGITYDKSQIR